MDKPARTQLATGGRLWGTERVSAGISMSQLAKRAGVSKGLISLMENGRMVPTSEEYDRITRALAEIRSVASEEAQSVEGTQSSREAAL